MNSYLPDVVRFTSFLTLNPKPSDVLLALSRDYLHSLKLESIQLYSLLKTNFLELRAECGTPKKFPSGHLSQKQLEELEKTISTENICKDVALNNCICDPENKLTVTPFHSGTSLQGFFLFEWAEDGEVTKLEMELLALYSSLASIYFTHSKQLPAEQSKEISTNAISPRQSQILKGMIEGKTNHELATELGFSVSTIRHETMAIFRALGVSDRKEAAKAAQLMQLI